MAKKEDNEKRTKTNEKKVEKRKKPKTIELDPSNVVPGLEALLEMAKNGEINNFVFGGISKDGEFISTVCDCSLSNLMSILGYLQSIASIKVLTEAIDFIEE